MAKEYITCRLQRLVPCKRPPLELAELKEFLKITHANEDNLLQNIIYAVSERFELYTAKALLTQIWQADYNRFAAAEIALPIDPVQHIQSIYLFDSYHNQSTLSDELYELHNGIIYLRMPAMAANLQVIFIVGYGDEPSAIPAALQMLLSEHAAHLYEKRGLDEEFPLSRYDAFRKRRL
jgi:uncharacterized phiE125 gp8 family phage protein